MIQNAICDVELIFRNVSSLSNDYDYTDDIEEVSNKIARYVRRHIKKIDSCVDIIKYHSAFLKPDDDMTKKIKDTLSEIEWFSTYYYDVGGDSTTLDKQVAWRDGQLHLDEKIDKLLKVAEKMKC